MVSLLLSHAWASSAERLAVAVMVTLGFAFVARALRAVDVSGAAAGGVACFLLFGSVGPVAFATLAALFVLTWGSTRVGHDRKLALGVAERRGGRNGWQVLANLGVASLASVTFSATGDRVWRVAALAALCEAACDTVASEIGESRGARPRMVTTWKRVQAGTDGGITISGSMAGVAASLVIALVGRAGGMVLRSQLWIPVVAGIAGMVMDSLLGATLQRRGWINNQTVNLLSTLAAALLAYGLVERAA